MKKIKVGDEYLIKVKCVYRYQTSGEYKFIINNKYYAEFYLDFDELSNLIPIPKPAKTIKKKRR